MIKTTLAIAIAAFALSGNANAIELDKIYPVDPQPQIEQTKIPGKVFSTDSSAVCFLLPKFKVSIEHFISPEEWNDITGYRNITTMDYDHRHLAPSYKLNVYKNTGLEVRFLKKTNPLPGGFKPNHPIWFVKFAGYRLPNEINTKEKLLSYINLTPKDSVKDKLELDCDTNYATFEFEGNTVISMQIDTEI